MKQPGKIVRSGEDSRKELLKFNLVLFFSLLAIIFILPVMPLEAHLVTRIILIILVVSGLFAAEFKAKLFRFLSVLGVLVISVTAAGIFFPEAKSLTILLFFLNTFFFVIVTVALVTHVAQANRVDGSTVLCAINSYLLIGLSLTLLMVILDLVAPNSFGLPESDHDTFSTFIYFAFVTLTTLGYGDISPITPVARSLSTFTALLGQLYLVIIMALIVGKYLNTKGTGQELK